MKKLLAIGIVTVTAFAANADIPVTTKLLPIGGKDGILIAKYPVTNAEYARFVKDTGHAAPRYWKGGEFPKGKERHPVLWVSYDDARAYCDWLGKKDSTHTYRLPTEEEWETAAGETPTDVKFNFNGVVASHYMKENPKRLVTFVHPKSALRGKSLPLDEVISIGSDGSHVRGWVNHRDYTGFIYTDLFKELGETGGYTTPVDAYSETKSACGALDMWGTAGSGRVPKLWQRTAQNAGRPSMPSKEARGTRTATRVLLLFVAKDAGQTAATTRSAFVS